MIPERENAESLGIKRGKTVERHDWNTAAPVKRPPIIEAPEKSNLEYTPRGYIVERINRITTSAGDMLWRCLARHFVEAAQ